MFCQTFSAFKQQKLPSCQVVFTPGTALPIFFILGIAFIPVGIVLVYFSEEVQEKIIDYTLCHKSEVNPDGYPNNTDKTCANILKGGSKESEKKEVKQTNQSCLCVIPFKLDSDFKGRVFMYYGLTNFYQNHRRYVSSYDENQLLGYLNEKPSHKCKPFDYNEDGKPIVPCGAIANSLFSDVLTLKKLNKQSKKFVDVPVLRTGIAWESDKNNKFRNPPGNLKKAFEKFSKPKAWKKNIWELDEENSNNNGLNNEDLIVWMRTAPLPNFKKLYRRIDHSKKGYGDGLLKGNYQLHVTYNYDVSSFDCTKKMILSTASILGGKNPFLGLIYIVAGCICLIVGIIFLFIQIRCRNRSVVDASKKRWDGNETLILK